MHLFSSLHTFSEWPESTDLGQPREKGARETSHLVLQFSGANFQSAVLVMLCVLQLLCSPSGLCLLHWSLGSLWSGAQREETGPYPRCSPCASLCQDFPSFLWQKLCFCSTHPKNVFKMAKTKGYTTEGSTKKQVKSIHRAKRNFQMNLGS